MTTVSIHEAKTHLSSLIHSMDKLGEPIIICRHRQAVAELIPIPRGKRTAINHDLQPIKIGYDPTEATNKEWSDI